MKKRGITSRNGFTIVETSLVLAIAGLIFLMVFIALPALQRSRRDTDRREDMILLVDKIKKFQSNNRGALPSGTGDITGVTYSESAADTTSWAGFYKNYLGNNFIDPAGSAYTLNIYDCGSNVVNTDCTNKGNIGTATFPNDFKIIIVRQASCNGEKAVASSNPRKLAVLYKLEGGGIYCGNT